MSHCIRILIALFFLASTSCQRSTPQLSIYAASSLKQVIEPLGLQFQAKNGVQLQFNFASSGTLARQINARPQADVFLSANQHWMDIVETNGNITQASRCNILGNTLLIVCRGDAAYTSATLNHVFETDFRYCVLGDPAHVPVGHYAHLWLQSLNLWELLDGRRSFAPDAQAVISQVLSRKDLIGIVYQSDYISRQTELKVLYHMSASEGPSIEYPVAMLTSSASPELAKQFIEFLQGSESQEAFRDAGFIAVP